MDPEISSNIASTFLDRGLLGAVSLVCIGVAMFFYREKRLVEARERALYDRHLTKAEEWITRYNEHASDMKVVLDSLSRRM